MKLLAFLNLQGRAALGACVGDELVDLFNDGSTRDHQLRTSQWLLGKNFDATGAFGPVFVTADELPLGAAGLRIQCRLNGKTLRNANTRDMMNRRDRRVAQSRH